MEMIILAIFKAQANVLAPPSLSPTSLPIRLLQSSQHGYHDHKGRCAECTTKICRHIPKPTVMARCVTFQFSYCIDQINFYANLEKISYWFETM
jgi:hypothetical protein